jgi:RNA-binding protein YlmH
MDRQKLIASLAETQEDQVLLARVWDKIAAGERKNIPSNSCFLSGREQILTKRLLEQGGLPEPQFFGGFPGAERQVAAYVPDYYDPAEFFAGEDSPVAALRLTYSQYDSLSHRDFLGSLMGQGIKREILGDLLPAEQQCDILVLRDMADYLASQLTQVGRVRVQVQKIALADIQVPEQKVKVITDTVASLRLDSVLASGFQQGRSKAAAFISAGRVEVDHMTVTKPDALVNQGSILSVRGLGKLRVAQVKGQTKKGRTALVLERYL